MNGEPFRNFDHSGLPTPVHVIDTAALRRNLAILADVQEQSGARIIHALKAFAQWSVFPIMREYLSGATASSLAEARLAHEDFTDHGRAGEVHITAPAYTEAEIGGILNCVDHIVFNTFTQFDRFRERVERHNRNIECGIRVNPEHSEAETALYDPCAPGSRLGSKHAVFEERIAQLGIDAAFAGISGLHFHTLCEQGLPPLERTLAVFEKKFGAYLTRMRWVNFGGGHHITKADYDRDGLVRLITEFRNRHPHLKVYLEPGEASVVETGVLVSTVQDILPGTPPIAVLDTSATAHMPDVLEMPYRPEILDASEPGIRKYTYNLGGLTCLAGDVIGEYSFDHELQPGDRLIFLDMSHYTMVKNTMFNGVGLPAIAVGDTNSGELRVVREFGFEDYRRRLS